MTLSILFYLFLTPVFFFECVYWMFFTLIKEIKRLRKEIDFQRYSQRKTGVSLSTGMAGWLFLIFFN